MPIKLHVTKFFLHYLSSVVLTRIMNLCLIRSTRARVLSPLTISLSSIVTINDNQILGSVIMLAAQVALEDSLSAIGISLLRIEGGTGHVGDHGVSAAEGVLCVAEGVVLGCWLREPDVSSVAAEVA